MRPTLTQTLSALVVLLAITTTIGFTEDEKPKPMNAMEMWQKEMARCFNVSFSNGVAPWRLSSPPCWSFKLWVAVSIVQWLSTSRSFRTSTACCFSCYC